MPRFWCPAVFISLQLPVCFSTVSNLSGHGTKIQAVSITAGSRTFTLDGCPGGDPNGALSNVLFSSLNLSFPGLDAVKNAVNNGNITGACNEIALYYASAPTARWLRMAAPPQGSSHAGGAVDEIMLDDKYDFYGEIGKVPRMPDGGLNWTWLGPVDDLQFPLALNRHEAWNSFLSAWNSTGNPDYSRVFDARVADWTSHHLPAPQAEAHDSVWMSLEAGIRASGSWPNSFFGFQNAIEFRASSRCAMVAGFAEHGRYLQQYGSSGNTNFRSMQYDGLGMISLTFPELKNASLWYTEALEATLADMADGVYPDGVEDEETSGYHYVALMNFDLFLSDIVNSGKTPDPRMAQVVEKMYNYLAYSLDPTGYSPLNSDSDTTYTAPRILAAASRFNRSDWLYIASNGDNGKAPDGPPSAMFPWAGQLISRSGWNSGAHWSWFDCGPYGSSGHGHRDKTHLSVRLGGVQILVDSGRFAYEGVLAPYRANYGVLSRAHNVLLLDNKSQVAAPARATAALENDTWLISDTEDRARASITFSGIQGDATHTRSVVYARGKFWVVVDRVVSDRPRDVEAIWHVHPNCTAFVTNATTNAQAQHNETGIGLTIVPVVGPVAWKTVAVIKGQTEPDIQGWYSRSYSHATPNPTISYRQSITQGMSSFAWLLVPTKQTASAASAKIVSENSTTVVIETIVDQVVETFAVSF